LKNNNIKIAKNLRKNVTNTEKYLWKYLKGNQLEGYKFRRQHPIGKYIVDFVNLERKIIIELDGGQHSVFILARYHIPDTDFNGIRNTNI
jgi:very-short-patch-repair endonuclease